MAFQIRISPEVLRAAADRHRAVADAVSNAREKLGNMYSDLNAAWDGGASNMALNTLQQFRDAAAQLGEGTNEGAEKLSSIAAAFEALDNEGAIAPIAIVRKMGNLAALIGIPPKWLIGLKGELRIIPDEVRVIGERSRALADEMEQTAHELRATLKTLENSWEGRAYSKFAEETYETINGFLKFADHLNEFGSELHRTAARYEELDNTLM